MLRTHELQRGRRVVIWLCLSLFLAAAPFVAHAAVPKKSDSPAARQDAALTQAVKTRLAAWGDPHVRPSAQPAAPGQPAGLPFDDGSRKAPGARASVTPACALCGVAIEARNGSVQLSGKVRTPEHRAAAENLARGVPGVRTVTNAIAVGP